MNDEYKFSLIGGEERPFEGYVSARDRTMMNPRFLVRGSKNVYFKRSGTIATRSGLKRRGSADATQADVKSSTEWDTSLGFTRPLRVANGKLEVESDIVSSGTYVWYTLLSGLTATRLIFDTWWNNTLKKDVLLFCDGSADLKNWSGAIGLISSTTVNTIVLTSTVASLGFTSAGTVIINGTEYTYSGVSGSTLTGVGTDPTGEANNSVVLQKPTTNSNIIGSEFLVDFIKVVGNQVYYGSETSRLLYISTNSDYTDTTANSPRTIGDADILTLDEPPVGIGQRDGKAHVATRKGWYVISFNQITVGTDLTEQTIVEKKPMASKKGALRHEFISNVGDDLIYLSEDQQLHVFGTFRNINQPQFPSLSDDVFFELENEDFTGGHLKTAGDFIYLTAPNNGRVWLHETRTQVNSLGNIEKKRLWHPPFIWNISRIAVIGGIEYGHSNANPQLYQMWNTLQWEDDSPADEALPYDCVAAFSYRKLRRDELVSFDKAFYEGYYAPGSEVISAIVYEYQGERTVIQAPIANQNVTPEAYIGDVGAALGEATLGDNPLGDIVSDEEADQELLPKFRIITDLEEQHVFEYQQRVYSTTSGSRWELIALGTNQAEADEESTYLRN